jgi:hypothetical protein
LKYHIALSRVFDFQNIAQKAQAAKSPKHVMWEISQTLGASVYQPTTDIVLPLDKSLR